MTCSLKTHQDHSLAKSWAVETNIGTSIKTPEDKRRNLFAFLKMGSRRIEKISGKNKANKT
jgi:hypothetical protein